MIWIFIKLRKDLKILAKVRKGLGQLKLAGIAKSIEDKIDYATEAKLSFLEFIKILLETEFSSRKNNYTHNKE